MNTQKTITKDANALKRVAGFTLDQTILVVAVIAVLATVIISSVAWDVLSKANATKLTAHLTQIGDAMGQYYRDNSHQWPTDSTQLVEYLGGSYSSQGPNDLRTPFASGSTPSSMSIPSAFANGRELASGSACDPDDPSNDCYVVMEMTNVDTADVVQADKNIDGEPKTAAERTAARTNGRLRWSGTSSTTTVTFFATKRY